LPCGHVRRETAPSGRFSAHCGRAPRPLGYSHADRSPLKFHRGANMETLTAIYEFLKPYFAVIALAVTWVGLGFAWWRRRGQWRRKEFLGQVNFSLNLFGDTLAMRTLLECDTTEVWPNAHGVGLLHAAAARTSDGDPFIRLAAKADRDYL